MTPHSYKIFFYLALPCEAKPLIAHYNLKKDLNIDVFSVFGHDDICLTVTGLGKTAMAAAVAYTQAMFNSPNPVLVNVGVAGHKEFAIGDLFLADNIVDMDSGRCFYPPLVLKTDMSSCGVFTKAVAQLQYEHTALCDMEASAFYETAIRFTSSELVQCLKVVSDNAKQPAHLLNAEQVSRLLQTQCQTIAEFVARVALLKLPFEQPHALFEQLTQRYHFSTSAKTQLQSLLQRWAVLTDNQPLAIETITFKHSKELLNWLEWQLNQTCFSIQQS